MAVRTGISGQLMMKAETVYGTAVVVDRTYEFMNEGIKDDVGKVDGFQIGSRFLRHDRVKTFGRGAAGPIEFIVLNKNFGLLFEHAIGQNTVSGASANKTHTIIPDANGLYGKSLTVQVGRPDVGGTVRAFTYEGGKITGWELKCAVDGPLFFTPEFDFETVANTATALATPSIVTTQEMFIFTEGALTVGGTTVFVKDVSIKGNNGLNVERRGLGNTKKEPLPAGVVDYLSGTMSCEFEDLTAYAAWVAGTQAQLILTFTLATVIPTSAVAYSLTVTIPKIEYSGENPVVADADILMQNRPFRALYDGTNAMITIAIVTSDTAS